MSTRATTPGPGEQQQGESDVAYAAFRKYLDMGEKRSTARVAQACGKHKSLMDRWSRRHRWVARVRQWTGEVVAAGDVERKEALLEIARQQAAEARVHARATSLVGDELLRRLEEKPGLLRRMKLETLVSLQATMARAHNRAIVTERLAHGMTTEQAGEALPRSVAQEQAARMTDDELEAALEGIDELAAQRAKRRRRARAS